MTEQTNAMGKESRGQVIKPILKGVKKRHSNDLQKKKTSPWFHGSEMQKNHRAVLRLTASIHTKRTTNSQRHHPLLGHKQAVLLGNTSKCLFGWGYYWWGINENQTPQFTSNSGVAQVLSECCCHDRKVKHHIKNKSSLPQPTPIPPRFPPLCSALTAATPNHLSLFVLFTR